MNGTPVDQAGYDARWSWLAVLQIENSNGQFFRCGASFITDSVLLSAAHCFADPALGTVTEVTVGRGSPNTGSLTFIATAAEWVTNPSFDPVTFANDVALIRLAAPAPGVQPVLMASQGDIPQSGRSEAAGWGRISENPPTQTAILHEAAAPIQGASYCNEAYGGAVIDPAIQICAGLVNDAGTDPNVCQGDSGGPLVERGTIETTLVGITSFGSVPCGFYPAGFAAVGGFRDYIDPIVNTWDPGGLATVSPVGAYVPLQPQRIHDTRFDGTGTLPALSTRTFQIGGLGGVPATGATAALLQITAADPAADGYLTTYPCDGETPYTSTNNYAEGKSVGNVVAVGLSDSGTVCVYTWADTNVVIDVNGYWQAEGPAGALFNAIPPNRLFDSRNVAGRAEAQLKAGQILPISVAELAATPISAVALNVTAVEPTEGGYITAYPCDSPVPPTSNVNVYPYDIVANGLITKTSADERVCMVSSVDTDVVVDATGWFSTPGSTQGGRVVPLEPERLVDTRLTSIVSAGETLVVPTAGVGSVPADALGAVLNVTAVDSVDAGYLTAYPCGEGVPPTSTVNYEAFEDVPNLTFTGLGDGGAVCVFAYTDVQIVVDVTGYVTI